MQQAHTDLSYRLRTATLAAVLLCACFPSIVQAELLQRLHVVSFTVNSDTPHPHVGVPFHVSVTIRARERITQLQYVYQPTFPGLEKIADRHSLTYVAGGGSVYRETLTLVAHKPGPTAIGSAYLDAVDLSDGKTKRFFSNDLVLSAIGIKPPSAWEKVRTVLLILLGLLLVAAAVLAVVRNLRRRHLAAGPQPVLQPVFAAAAPAMSFDEALANLRARRDRSSVLRVREALWSIAGANQGETLADVLQRGRSRADGLSGILIAVERATFTNDGHLQQAIDTALLEAERGGAR